MMLPTVTTRRCQRESRRVPETTSYVNRLWFLPALFPFTPGPAGLPTRARYLSHFALLRPHLRFFFEGLALCCGLAFAKLSPPLGD